MSAGDDALADVHLVVVRYILHFQQRLTGSAYGALNARFREHRASATLFVGNEQNLRGVGKRLDHFPNDAIRRDDAHIPLNSVALAAIDVNCPRGGVRAGADHARAQRGYLLM